MWSCKCLCNQSVGSVGVGIREEKRINQMILCGKWGSKCLMAEEAHTERKKLTSA